MRVSEETQRLLDRQAEAWRVARMHRPTQAELAGCNPAQRYLDYIEDYPDHRWSEWRGLEWGTWPVTSWSRDRAATRESAVFGLIFFYRLKIFGLWTLERWKQEFGDFDLPWYVRSLWAIQRWIFFRSFQTMTCTVLGLRFTREFAEDLEDATGSGLLRNLFMRLGGWGPG